VLPPLVFVRNAVPPEISGVLCAAAWIAAKSAPMRSAPNRRVDALRLLPQAFVELFQLFHMTYTVTRDKAKGVSRPSSLCQCFVTQRNRMTTE
jgi:hypothetical protein